MFIFAPDNQCKRTGKGPDNNLRNDDKNGDKNNIEKAAVRAAAGEIRTNAVQKYLDKYRMILFPTEEKKIILSTEQCYY